MRDVNAVLLEHRANGDGGALALAASEAPAVFVRIMPKGTQFRLDNQQGGSFQTLRGGQGLAKLVDAFTELLSRAWQSRPDAEGLSFEHVVAGGGAEEGETGGGDHTKLEVKATRLGGNAVVIVVRDVSERFRLFEAEKRFVFETTARQKDAEANRFTRHEVKNGLLGAIEICGNMREQLLDDFGAMRKDSGYGCPQQ